MPASQRAPRKGWLTNLATSVVTVTLVLLLLEAAVRVLWTDAPPSLRLTDTLPITQVRDPEILYRLIPGATGHFNGTEIKVNSLGLRDREYQIPAPPGIRRILVLGDSIVFGVGLEPEQTLSGQLSRLLAPDEAINAGVFGYNLAQEISLLKDVGLRYRPDVVVSCFVHNDIENWGLGEGGAVPVLRSSRFEPPSDDTWSARLATLLLPDAFDQEHLTLLPRAAGKPGFRQRLCMWSRLYLFTYMRLRTHSWNLTGGETVDPFLASPACETRQVIWDPLRARYRELKRTAEAAGARLVVVVFGGLLLDGRPLERLLTLLEQEGIPVVDLTPAWLDRDFYAKEYSLGWDPHPSERADALAAELVAAYLRLPRPPTGPHELIAGRADLRERLAKWQTLHAERIRQDDARWSDAQAGFSAAVRFAGAGFDAGNPEQVLYGFWRPAEGAVTGKEEGWWMSSRASVLLKPGREATLAAIDIRFPSVRQAFERTPGEVAITLATPPDRCEMARVVVPVPRPGPGGTTTVTAELPASLRGAGVVEVGLSVDHTYLATYLDPGSRDTRQLSFMISGISLR